MTPEQITNILNQIYIDIQTVLDLAKEGLLKSERKHSCILNIKKQFQEIKPYLAEIEQLKIERIIPVFINDPKTGVFVSENETRQCFEPLLELTTELINIIGGNIPQKDIFITENSPFEGRKILRSILNEAKNKILIVDGYLRPEILEIIQLNLIDNPNIELCFLTQKNNNRFFNTFSADIKSLSAQYPNTKIELRYYDKLAPHDRYIIIDENAIYHSGHSFAELGNRASSISKVEGNAYDIAKNNISSLWLNGLI